MPEGLALLACLAFDLGGFMAMVYFWLWGVVWVWFCSVYFVVVVLVFAVVLIWVDCFGMVDSVVVVCSVGLVVWWYGFSGFLCFTLSGWCVVFGAVLGWVLWFGFAGLLLDCGV